MSAPHKLCMIPGPIEFHEDVLQAMSTPATSHVAPTFIPVLGESIELLRNILFTSGQPFIIAGSGTLGWDMTACNLIEAGEEVLVCNTGYFGDRFGECLETYGAKVTHHRVPIGDAPNVDEVRKLLKSKQFKAITITHVDTSTGVLADIQRIAGAVRELSPNTLVVVDGVCSVGSEEIRMDAWGIDVVVTASQKALGAPPGLCVMGVSERAIEVFKARKTPVANYYANWNRWLPIMKAYEERRASYFATPAVQNVMALHVSLKQIVSQGIENRFVVHKDAAEKARKFIADLGLRLVPTDKTHTANGMSAVYYPKDVTAMDLLPRLAARNVVAAGGLHVEIATQYFRIGHMGISHIHTSAGSSTPPSTAGTAVDGQVLLPRLHLIDEDKQFSDGLSRYISEKWNLKDSGFNYNIAAVFGSQSTGKSTLLNRLFGTNFDVMSESARMQTTKGIWISKGKDMKVLIMDVEGTDGRERGEDQDFERKSALFSLATSEVLIVNMWEHQVGLYNGANMGLLKTVFEVNLQLFGGNRGKEKTLLLFVIRDHVGVTPLANLSNTLRADLDMIWQGLSKVLYIAESASFQSISLLCHDEDGLEQCKITDYFDFMFTTLSHKLLQPEKFESEIDQLRLRFMNPSDPNYVFQPQYSRCVPADGLHVYAQSIWEKIMTNKDLDLPTQQELLAQFRCDEIANAAFMVFTEAIKEFRHPIEAGHLVDGLGPKMKEIRSTAIKSFDKDASRYHSEVYKRKRTEVLAKSNTMLKSYFLGQLKNLHKKAIMLFSAKLQEALRKEGAEFAIVSSAAKNEAAEFFLEGAKAIKLDETDWEYDEELYQVEHDLQELSAAQREKELAKMSTELEKRLQRELDEPIKLALDKPGPAMWDRVITIYQRKIKDAETVLHKKAKTFELDEKELESLVENLRKQGWVLVTMKVQEECVDGLILYKLLSRFEEMFQRDDQGLPRVWKPVDDIDTPFCKARDETMALIPLYARIVNLDPATGTPFRLESSEDFDFDQSLHVISKSRQQELATQFKRKADASYVEAKRSTVVTQVKVPYWVSVALVILGWNEFIAVIANPLYLSVTVMVGIPLAALWYLNMLSVVQAVGWKAYGQTMTFVMDILRYL
ncbi:Dynamin-like GTPase that mediates homotypic ER fusion [Modicella reniformis]|uniref:alanine--glyoxylate transaminase n=1 Tax=Modicella reniformis TaxID=1440133 RepID=A0A9P6J5D8_9FUNG|nr:Dynamin-like GTPase that mediates homotypic ER fusion [Modicella reniformis]